MTEDGEVLRVVSVLAAELQTALDDFTAKCFCVTDVPTLLALRLEQNELLAEILRKHRRHLRLMNGEQIEPETHYVECVMVGTGFGGFS